LFTSIRFPRAPEADFAVGGHRFAAFSHDRRSDPIERWIEVKTALDPEGEHATANDVAPLELLSQPDFEAAVRQALRDLHSTALGTNPLLRSRLAYAHARGAPTPTSLRALIREAAADLHGPSARAEKLYRALDFTYLAPAATQELAAERLGLPFNTYRYQLAAAVKRLSEILWQRELQADTT